MYREGNCLFGLWGCFFFLFRCLVSFAGLGAGGGVGVLYLFFCSQITDFARP